MRYEELCQQEEATPRNLRKLVLYKRAMAQVSSAYMRDRNVHPPQHISDDGGPKDFSLMMAFLRSVD